MRGRHDLAQHVGVSAALTALSGPRAAEAAGLLKELLDSGEGGSVFSFADLAADLADLAKRWNRNHDGTIAVPAEYLETILTLRG